MDLRPRGETLGASNHTLSLVDPLKSQILLSENGKLLQFTMRRREASAWRASE
jgi:hypothetical protein